MIDDEVDGQDPTNETVDDFAVSVEEHDEGWVVVKTANGEQTVVDTHPDEKSARLQADQFEDAATRYDGAVREEEVPPTHPGKGANETQHAPSDRDT